MQWGDTVKLLFIALLVSAVAGCAAPEWGWRRTDGQSARNDPALMKQFESDRAACMGETQQAGLVGAAGGHGLPSGTLRSMRGQAAVDVVQDCMARKGYEMMPRIGREDAGPKLGM
jgi:hypothetical protein